MKRIILGSTLVLAATVAVHAEMLEVRDARVKNDGSTGASGVMVFFSPDAGKVLERLTRENIGRTVRLQLNGMAVLSPVVTAPITNRYILLSNLRPDLAERLASDIMKTGALEMIVPVEAPDQKP